MKIEWNLNNSFFKEHLLSTLRDFLALTLRFSSIFCKHKKKTVLCSMNTVVATHGDFVSKQFFSSTAVTLYHHLCWWTFKEVLL